MSFLKGFAPGIAAALLAVASAAGGQTAVNVRVEVDKPVNVMTAEALGVYTDVYDTGTIRPKVAAYLHAAGVYTLQFPGGYGSYADLFHWSTDGGTSYENLAKQDHFYPSEANMAHMTPAIESVGTAVITVNYGSNLAGTGGGEPAEAAAWVAYLNGDSASAQAIGPDSTGHDWKTVGYWASLRAAAPLPADDGLNGLRANHPRPLAIKLWQIGSQVYNNGYYGGDHKSEEDLHAPYPATEAENEKRRHNPKLSPAFYGERLNEFSRAMKAVDPGVWIGATLNFAPIDSAWGPDWNPEVLKAACTSIDFAAFNWVSDHRVSVDPYNVRDDAATLQAPAAEIGAFLKEAVYDFRKFCPAGHEPRVAVTQMAPVHWAKIPSKLADGLFAADATALLVETGTINIDWSELHDGFFLTGDDTPGPAFYGIQMLHLIAFRPGDQFVTASSSSPLLAVHAAHRPEGALGLMLINKDPANPVTVKVSLQGGAFAAQGSRFDYGPANFSALGPIAKSVFAAPDPTFTVTLPAYTITDIVLPKAH